RLRRRTGRHRGTGPVGRTGAVAGRATHPVAAAIHRVDLAIPAAAASRPAAGTAAEGNRRWAAALADSAGTAPAGRAAGSCVSPVDQATAWRPNSVSATVATRAVGFGRRAWAKSGRDLRRADRAGGDLRDASVGHVRHGGHLRHARCLRHAGWHARSDVLATTGGHPGQAAERQFAVGLDELGLHVRLVPRLVDRDGHFRGVLVDFRDAGDFCRGVIRNALGGCFSGPFLLQLVPELLARDGDQAVDVTRLQVIERLVGRRLGIISAEQDDQQDDAADDDEGADTAEDPGQRALLLGRFTAGETTGRWVAGWRALWRAVTTRPAPWWSVTAGLAVRRAVAWLLLRETAAGRLTLRVLGTRTLRAWWLGHLRPRLINATYGGGTEMSERQQRRERSGGAFHTKVAGTRAGPGHERGVCPPQFGRSGTSGRSGISGTLMSGISGM